MVEERHSALDGCRHAHLVLLHQQLVQISLDVRIQQLRQEWLAANARERAVVGRVWIHRRELRPQLWREQLTLCSAPKYGEIVEVELIQIRATHQERARRVLTEAGSHRQTFEGAAQAMARESRYTATVQRAESGVVFGHAIAVVAGERLVAPFASEHDLDVTRGQPGNEIKRDAGRVRDRLILVPHEPRKLGKELGGRDDSLTMLGAIRRGDEPGVFELVGLPLGESYREGPDRLLDERRHGGGDRRRIDPTGEEHTEWHVAHEP